MTGRPDNPYIGRTLTFQDGANRRQISDTGLAGLDRSLIILGEQGMGKTCLLEHLAKQHQWPIYPAASLVNIGALPVPAGGRLIVDGLDEIPAAYPAQPINLVLAKLVAAGCPPFILSCRTADWRAAIARADFSPHYPDAPLELRLEPLSPQDAIAFLEPVVGAARARDIVNFLGRKNIADVWGNPLTLKLLSEVALRDARLPETRGELMKVATAIMCREHNDRHEGSALASMSEDVALAAAGAACAACLLTGADAIALRPADNGQPNLLSISEIEALPEGGQAPALIGSRLFTPLPVGDGRFRPIHRSVAEYLGARWLERVSRDALARERVLAMLTVASGVPASLRGLHAWLAQYREFAAAVIATDPYGVLRYGDPDSLSVEEGRALLHGLVSLQRTDPYFRNWDWDVHTARGLAHPGLRAEMHAILVDPDTGGYLRTLLLEAIGGSPLAAELADDLSAMVVNAERRYHYGERRAAASAIAAGQAEVEWPAILEGLVAHGDADSIRLLLAILGEIGFETMDAGFLARAIVALVHLPDGGTRDLRLVGLRLPDHLLSPLLDALASLPPTDVVRGVHDAWFELADLVDLLIVRQIGIAAPAPLDLLRWLRINRPGYGAATDNRRAIAACLAGNDAVRRAIQRQLIFIEQEHEDIWGRIWRLGDISAGLRLTPQDLIHFLAGLSASPDRSEAAKEVWRGLLSSRQWRPEDHSRVIAAATSFAGEDPDLAAFLGRMGEPLPVAAREVDEERRRNAEALATATMREQQRPEFAADIAAVRSGELHRSLPIARVYLDHAKDGRGALSGAGRVEEWLGADLLEAALSGLEAVLHRTDVPTPEQVARGFLEGRCWYFMYPMVAAVMQRLVSGGGLDGITSDVLIAARIALRHLPFGEAEVRDSVSQALDAHLRRDPDIYERYIRQQIEPALESRSEHAPGLPELMQSAVDRPLALRLAGEWLGRYSGLPVWVETTLIDALADAGESERLRRVASRYATDGYDSDERRLLWLAAGVLSDFERTSARIGRPSAADRDLIFHLAHRFGAGFGEKRRVAGVRAEQLGWIVAQFRTLWPYRSAVPGRVHDSEASRAMEIISAMIDRIAGDDSDGAAGVLGRLATDQDGYADLIRHAVASQRQQRREREFRGITLDTLKDAIEHRPPRTSRDLLAVVRHALTRLQERLRGSDTDPARKYWRDDGTPHDEHWCADRMIEDLERVLAFPIPGTPEADMPDDKRVDLLYSAGDSVLPVECKVQRNRELWSAAAQQLGARYLADWRAECGIYLVYWFGPDQPLQGPPGRAEKPGTPGALQEALAAALPDEWRGRIDVVVLDLSAGRRRC